MHFQLQPEDVIVAFKSIANAFKIFFSNPAVHEQNLDPLLLKLMEAILTLTKNIFNSEVEKALLDEYISFIKIIGKGQLNDEAKTSISNTFNYFLHLIKEDDESDEIEQVLRNVLGDFIPAVIRGEVTTDEVLRYYMYNKMVRIIHFFNGTNDSNLFVLKDTDDAGLISKIIIFIFAKLIIPWISQIVNENFEGLSCIVSIGVEFFQEYENGYIDDLHRPGLQVN